MAGQLSFLLPEHPGDHTVLLHAVHAGHEKDGPAWDGVGPQLEVAQGASALGSQDGHTSVAGLY